MGRARRTPALVLAVALGAGLVAALVGGPTGSAVATGVARDRGRAEPTDRCPTDGAPVRDLRYARVPGVDPRRLALDVHPVAFGCPSPVVVWVHGGGWRVGDKRFHLADKVRHWNALGYTVVSVNYRLTDPTAADPVRYPTHQGDVATAVAWVHDRIGRYGGDPDRVALVGHSAGAQIVAALATDPSPLGAHDLVPSDLRCVAPLDTEGFDVARRAGRGARVYLDAFGPDPAVWAEASPITHLRAHGTQAAAVVPPHLLVRRGSATRQRTLQEYVDALAAGGVAHTVVAASGLSHADVNRLIGTEGDTIVTPALDGFLGACFAEEPAPTPARAPRP